MRWTFFGKTPLEADFVRHDLSSPLAMQFFRWLADAVAQTPAATKHIAHGGVRFVWTHDVAPHSALVGVLVPSRDRVGREFPFVAMTELRRSDLSPFFPALPLAWAETLATARSLALRAHVEPLASIATDAASLAMPLDLATAHARTTRALARASMSEVHERLFPGLEADACYAYLTVRTAAGLAGRADAPALVCPTTLASDAAAWLELVRRLAPARAPLPTFLWTTGTGAHLVISMGGALPHAALAAVSGATPDASRVWPLATPSEAARSRARTVITPLLPGPHAPYDAVLDALSGRSSP